MNGDKNNNIRYGWVCPKCGAVMAPDTMACIYCNGTIAYINNEKLSKKPVLVDGIPPSPTTKTNYPPNFSISTVDMNDSNNYTITSETREMAKRGALTGPKWSDFEELLKRGASQIQDTKGDYKE